MLEIVLGNIGIQTFSGPQMCLNIILTQNCSDIREIIIIIISTIFIQDSLFSKDITAITKGPVKIKVCKVKEKRSK